MTDTTIPRERQIPIAKRERMRAKRRAWNCFLEKQNSLTLIAAVLIPVIMFMAGQGIYSMIYLAFDGIAGGAAILSWIDLLLILLSFPLVGGTMYIVTGLARGEDREVRDIFYAYTSWRTHFRTWAALLLPMAVLSAVVSVASVLIEMARGLSHMAWKLELDEMYTYLFFDGGISLAVLMGLFGLMLTGYVMPFFWLVFLHPEQTLRENLSQSGALIRGHLWAWVMLQLSFIGWLLLSVATVCILLPLFVLPYYLMTVTYYLGPEPTK